MSRGRIALVVAWAFAFSAMGADRVDPARVDELVKALGDASFEKREAASATIRKMGKEVVPLLQKVESTDPEVSARVQSIVRDLTRKVVRVEYVMTGQADGKLLEHGAGVLREEEEGWIHARSFDPSWPPSSWHVRFDQVKEETIFLGEKGVGNGHWAFGSPSSPTGEIGDEWGGEEIRNGVVQYRFCSPASDGNKSRGVTMIVWASVIPEATLEEASKKLQGSEKLSKEDVRTLWKQRILENLESERSEVHAAALEVLTQWKFSETAPVLRKIISGPKVSAGAVAALSGVGSVEDLGLFVKTLACEDPKARIAALQALQKMGKVNSVDDLDALCKLLDDRSIICITCRKRPRPSTRIDLLACDFALRFLTELKGASPADWGFIDAPGEQKVFEDEKSREQAIARWKTWYAENRGKFSVDPKSGKIRIAK